MSGNKLNIIKEKLRNFEMEYNHLEWLRLEKELPKKPYYAISSSKIIAGIVAVVAIVALVFIYNTDKQNLLYTDKISNNAEQVFKNVNIKDTHARITKSDKIYKEDKQSEIKSMRTTDISDKEIIKHEKSETDTEKIGTIIKEQKIEKDFTERINHQQKLKDIYTEVIIDNHCEPALVKFKAVNLPENYHIVWDADNNYKLKGINPETYYQEAGTYNPKAFIVYEDKIIKSIETGQIIIKPATNVSISHFNSDNTYYFSVNKISDNTEITWKVDDNTFYDNSIRYDFNKPGIYNIQVEAVNKYNCISEDNIQINIVIKQEFYLPNAFIPHSDNINSYFGPIGQNLDFKTYRMIIVDRTGRKVFETTDVNNKWNGKSFNEGDDSPEDIYLWEIFTIDSFGNSKTKKGRVNLIRK